VLLGLATGDMDSFDPKRATYKNYGDYAGVTTPSADDQWDTLRFAVGSTYNSYINALAALAHLRQFEKLAP
jgi:hypothetical protein